MAKVEIAHLIEVTAKMNLKEARRLKSILSNYPTTDETDGLFNALDEQLEKVEGIE